MKRVSANLLSPLVIGDLEIPNRVVMAPLTRCRSGEDRVPDALTAEYYAQRASAGLIITEATVISPTAVGYRGTPGIWNAAQVEGWRLVTDAVHAQGGRIFLQLWHVGRISDPELLDGETPVAPSAVRASGRVRRLRPHRPYSTPRALTQDEITEIVADFHRGAQNARLAGFDGVEIHAANGYLIDQFLQDSTNLREDHYGGTLENRTRFLLDIVDAAIEIWGPGRVGVHLRPRGEEHDMGDSDPRSIFEYAAEQLGARNIAFLFVREIEGDDSLLSHLRSVFAGPVIANEEMGPRDGARLIEGGAADAVAFGRDYIATPDIVERLSVDAPFNEPNPATFYWDPGVERSVGYTDYPRLVETGPRTA